MMSKVKQIFWIVALVLAFVAPIAGAEETSSSPSWFDQLVAQIVAAVLGPAEPPAAAFGTPPSVPEPELGEHVPVSG